MSALPTSTRRRAGSISMCCRQSVRAAPPFVGADLALVTAAEQRADARHQLADAERFRQVVVGAAVETKHFVRFLAPRGQHQDRRVGILPIRGESRGTR